MIGTAFADGLVLAAIVHDDVVKDDVVKDDVVKDDASGAACARGLAPGLARVLRERLEALSASSREERHGAVRALVSTLTAVPPDADAPARALAILATDVPRPVGLRWSAAAPSVRRGFRVTRGLKATLRRLAHAGSSDARGAELAAATRARALEPARLATLRRWAERLGGDDAERALGALVLGMEGDLAGDARSRRLRAIGRELAHVWEASWARP